MKDCGCDTLYLYRWLSLVMRSTTFPSSDYYERIYKVLYLTNYLTIWLCGTEFFSRSEWLVSYTRNFPHLMEPDCSLPWSQKPACLSLSKARSIQFTLSQPFSLLYLHLSLGFPSELLLHFSPPTPCKT